MSGPRPGKVSFEVLPRTRSLGQLRPFEHPIHLNCSANIFMKALLTAYQGNSPNFNRSIRRVWWETRETPNKPIQQKIVQ